MVHSIKERTSWKANRTGLLIEITEYLRLPLHPNKTVILNLSLRHCCRLHVKLVICQSTCSSRQLPSHFEEKPTSSSLVHTILHTRHAGTLSHYSSVDSQIVRTVPRSLQSLFKKNERSFFD